MSPAMAAPTLPLLALACALLGPASCNPVVEDNSRPHVESLVIAGSEPPLQGVPMSESTSNLLIPHVLSLPGSRDSLHPEISGLVEDGAATALPHRVLVKFSEQFCTTIIIGKVTEDVHLLEPINIEAKDSLIFIPDTLTRPGRTLVGQTVTACDARGPPPRVLAAPGEFSPVVVRLRREATGSDAVVYVLQHGQQFYQ